MALMQKLRERTHIIMIILVIAFVGLIGLEWGADMTGRGPGGQNMVGSINGQAVSYEEIHFEVEQLKELARQQQGGRLDEFRIREIINNVWDRRVDLVLLQQNIKKYGIIVTDAEILEAIRTNPPEFVKQQEVFLTDGNFDQAKYLQALNDPAVEGWEYLEEQFRMMIPRQKLINRVISGARITDEELRQAFINQNEELVAKYLFLNPDDLDIQPESISEDNIITYYKNHPDEFWVQPQVSLSYVMIPLQPSVADSQRVERQINELYSQILDGADFETLAKDFSEDPSNASNGGDLGFFAKDTMVPEFDKVAFETPPGSVAKPVKTQYGWHVIKVEEKRSQEGQQQVRARHILLKTIIGQQTLTELREQMRKLRTLALSSSLDEATQEIESSLEIEQTDYFTDRPDGFIPRIGYLVGASSFAFDSQPGDISSMLENEKGFFLLSNSGKKPEGVQPINDARLRIRSILVQEQKMKQALAQGTEIRNGLQNKNLEALTGELAKKVITTEPITRQQAFIPRIGQDMNFIQGAFKLVEPGTLSELIKGDRGYYLIQLVTRKSIDESTFDLMKGRLKQQLLTEKRNKLYEEWLSGLRENADIENNLRSFFPI